MTSVINFRMQRESKTMLQIHFTGHQIRLLDLQRLIMEKKQLKQGMDFDLIIMEADNTDKIFSGDDTYIPKNSSVVVKRVPKAKGTGLLSRLKGDAAYVSHLLAPSAPLPYLCVLLRIHPYTCASA